MKSVEIKSQSGEFHKKKYRAPVTGWGGVVDASHCWLYYFWSSVSRAEGKNPVSGGGGTGLILVLIKGQTCWGP